MNLKFIISLVLLKYASAWSYANQGSDWANSGNFCSGSDQSPIDIVRSDAIEDFFEEGLGLTFSTSYCNSISGTFANTDQTLKFQTDSTNPTDLNYITGGPLGEAKYYFYEFALHWGSDSTWGSEHLIDGQRMPAELHLMHVNDKYITSGIIESEAFQANDGFAILSIFLVDGSESQSSTSWFDFISSAASDIAQSGSTSAIDLNLNKILHRINPRFKTDFNYWHYNGSFTTPDCNEAVTWIISEHALPVSTAQLENLYQLLDSNSDPIVNNYREVQDLGVRDVYYVYKNKATEYTFQPCENGSYPESSTSCAECNCDTSRTVDGNINCNANGECYCEPSFAGNQCESCADGLSGQDCSIVTVCGPCDPTGTIGDTSGCTNNACQCKNGYDGVDCSECASGYTGSGCSTCVLGYYDISGICTDCECSAEGTISGSSSCSSEGSCECAEGYDPPKCSTCTEGYYSRENRCLPCLCNLYGKFNTNWNMGFDVECEDETGDCGTCFDGYTGLKCDMCTENYDLFDFWIPAPYVSIYECGKACPDGYALLNSSFTDSIPEYNDPDNIHFNEYEKMCFGNRSDEVTYDEAKASCEAEGGALAEPRTLRAANALLNHNFYIYQDNFFNVTIDDPNYIFGRFWIGYKWVNDQWVYESDGTPIPSNITSGMRNSFTADGSIPDNCGLLVFGGITLDPFLDSDACEADYQYICQRLSLPDEGDEE